MKTRLHALVLLASAGLVGPAFGLAPGEVVQNFRLSDQNGTAHELYDASGRSAIVIMVQGNGCPIVRQALPALAELRERYRSRGVAFLLLNPNLQDTREEVAEEAAEFHIDFPILLDPAQQVGESLGVERTAEVFVIDPKDWKLAYRGPLDDRLWYDRQKPAAAHAYLRDALEAVLARRPVAESAVEGVGCLIHFPARDRRDAKPGDSAAPTASGADARQPAARGSARKKPRRTAVRD
jgi:peroxiredoxin